MYSIDDVRVKTLRFLQPLNAYWFIVLISGNKVFAFYFDLKMLFLSLWNLQEVFALLHAVFFS